MVFCLYSSTNLRLSFNIYSNMLKYESLSLKRMGLKTPKPLSRLLMSLNMIIDLFIAVN